jgi:hypothetical protein
MRMEVSAPEQHKDYRMATMPARAGPATRDTSCFAMPVTPPFATASFERFSSLYDVLEVDLMADPAHVFWENLFTVCNVVSIWTGLLGARINVHRNTRSYPNGGTGETSPNWLVSVNRDASPVRETFTATASRRVGCSAALLIALVPPRNV